MTQVVTPELFVETLGKGEPIVLIHGGASSHRYWQTLAPILARNYRVIMPDLLGMGDSPKPSDSDYALSDYVFTLEKALTRAGVTGNYSVLAHSVGAIVGVALAKKSGSRVKRLVLSAPVFYTSSKSAKRLFGKAVAVPNWVLFGPSAWFVCTVFCRTKVIPRLIARMTFSHLPASATNDVTSHTWKSYVGMRDQLIVNQHALADLAELKNNVEVVVGINDPSMEPASIAQMDKMANIKLHRANAGHNLPFSQTDLLIELLTKE